MEKAWGLYMESSSARGVAAASTTQAAASAQPSSSHAAPPQEKRQLGYRGDDTNTAQQKKAKPATTKPSPVSKGQTDIEKDWHRLKPQKVCQDAMRMKAKHAQTIKVADVLKGNLPDNPEWSWASAPATIAKFSRAYENGVEADDTFAKQMQSHYFNDLKKTV